MVVQMQVVGSEGQSPTLAKSFASWPPALMLSVRYPITLGMLVSVGLGHREPLGL